MNGFRKGAAVGFLALQVGCSVVDPECPGNVNVRFEEAADGRFTWEPGCTINDLGVERLEDHQGMWHLDGNLRPPIVYGDNSQGTSAADAQPLVTGERYRVTLYREEGGGARIVGSLEFVR